MYKLNIEIDCLGDLKQKVSRKEPGEMWPGKIRTW